MLISVQVQIVHHLEKNILATDYGRVTIDIRVNHRY